MKRQKNMIFLLLVLVVLVGAVFAVNAITKEESPETGIQDLSEVIVAIDPDTVTSLSWSCDEEISFHRVDAGWEYAADANFPLDESGITDALNMLKSITASKMIENVDDWNQYGLDVPVCTVTITADTSYTLAFGAEASVSGGRYFSIGDGNAYIVDKNYMQPFSRDLYDLLVMESIPQMDSITALEIKTAGNTLNISYAENSSKSYSDHYVWFLNDNALDTELTGRLVSDLANLSWKKCSNFHASDLSIYGLDTPAATVRAEYDTGSFVLEIGNASGEDYFAKLPGSNMVYVIDGSIGDALLNASYETLMPDDVLALDWSMLRSAQIMLDGETYELVQESPAETDADGNVTKDATYTIGGSPVDASGILTALDTMESTSYAAGISPERGEEIRFLFHQDHSAYPQVELVLYQYDADVCLVMLNGEATVFVARSQVIDLTEAVNQLVLG